VTTGFGDSALITIFGALLPGSAWFQVAPGGLEATPGETFVN
jgi:hypothetical protein